MGDRLKNEGGALAATTPEPSEDFNMEARRRLKNEARLTSGLGKSKSKEFIVNIFWTKLWPRLEEAEWTKHEGTGPQQGSITFLPKTNLEERGDKISGDRYERIRDVLDRLEQKRSPAEAAVATLYHSLQDEHHQANNSNSPDHRGSHSRLNLKSPKMDLSWKDAKYFPRKQSRVGPEYQVAELPPAGSFSPDEHSQSIRSWDPKAAKQLCDEDNNLAILEAVPRNKYEAALALLAARSYSPGEDFVEQLEATPAANGSDWPPAKRAKFSELVFSLRKNLSQVRSAMEIDMSTCLAYYYAVFKHTNDYRLVKTVLQDENFQSKASQIPVAGEPDTCLICGDGGELLICDGCEGEYHKECLNPRLKEIPEGHWECDECVNKKLLAFRDYLVRQSGLFEAKDLDREDGAIIFKPTSSSMTSVRAMAQGISRLLAPTSGAAEDQDLGKSSSATEQENGIKQASDSTDCTRTAEHIGI
mmetsp:Transcript_12240/g.33955  ORF Transcript_12240/g.33955 Transcript_12240/m.33955 type:complete len:474 (+) Transcript_12240:133-1554(+)|eukprot:CAMPEP_0168728806 /NCGR_PEP_ID=MMETSP0724-20121128/5873_1 /TAXON_ID=265536 /ORGANISM="Amphiprora sp., Strain CCMP467" /LENGTH=473 /DNA_ID=CAMNT_0008775661 /DNA_START=85 /DNA_END=1506 /DNA_ORIENTATION=+